SLARDRLQAVLVPSGCANASTGEGGLEDARRLGARTAAALGLGADEVAVSSTGVIGERMDMPRALAGIEAAAAVLSLDGGPRFARAICTTDRWTKTWAARVPLSTSGPVLIGGTAKGGGMISPCMATMLAYVTTDAAVSADPLARARDDGEAETVARAIANSPLVKAAIYGRDPNWGRVAQAVGHALADRGGPEPRLSLSFDGLVPGDPELAGVMDREEYDLAVGLGR